MALIKDWTESNDWMFEAGPVANLRWEANLLGRLATTSPARTAWATLPLGKGLELSHN